MGQTWGHAALWEAIESQGVSSLTFDDPASSHFKNQIRKLNPDISGQRWKSGNRVGINMSLMNRTGLLWGRSLRSITDRFQIRGGTDKNKTMTELSSIFIKGFI